MNSEKNSSNEYPEPGLFALLLLTLFFAFLANLSGDIAYDILFANEFCLRPKAVQSMACLNWYSDKWMMIFASCVFIPIFLVTAGSALVFAYGFFYKIYQLFKPN